MFVILALAFAASPLFHASRGEDGLDAEQHPDDGLSSVEEKAKNELLYHAAHPEEFGGSKAPEIPDRWKSVLAGGKNVVEPEEAARLEAIRKQAHDRKIKQEVEEFEATGGEGAMEERARDELLERAGQRRHKGHETLDMPGRWARLLEDDDKGKKAAKAKKKRQKKLEQKAKAKKKRQKKLEEEAARKEKKRAEKEVEEKEQQHREHEEDIQRQLEELLHAELALEEGAKAKSKKAKAGKSAKKKLPAKPKAETMEKAKGGADSLQASIFASRAAWFLLAAAVFVGLVFFSMQKQCRGETKSESDGKK